MAVLRINNGLTVLVSQRDVARLRKWTWRAVFSRDLVSIVRGGYSPDKGNIVVHLHRFIVGCPSDKDVLSRNGDRFDCRRRNLVICDKATKAFKRRIRSDNSTGFKGVSRRGGKFTATLQAYGRRYYGGIYSNPIDAAKAYDRLAQEHHGEFARLNFPRGKRARG